MHICSSSVFYVTVWLTELSNKSFVRYFNLTLHRWPAAIALSIILLVFLSQAEKSFAEKKEFTAEASYIMGDGETPAFAELMVLQKAKQIALEQAGTYVQSYTKLQNMDLTSDQITTLAEGILQTEVIKSHRSLIDDGLRFYIKIKTIVTTDRMEGLAAKVRSDSMAQDYKRLREDYVTLLRELNAFKSALPEIPFGPERDATLENIREREKSFRTIQQNETRLFERFISGEALFTKSRDEQSRRTRERETADKLFSRILEEGIKVTLGSPDTHTSLDKQDLVQVNIPVTIEITPEIKTAIIETARQLGGTVLEGGFKILDTPVKGTAVRIDNDMDIVAHFQRRIFNLTLILQARTSTTSISCYLSSDNRRFGQNRYFPILGITPGSIIPFTRDIYPTGLPLEGKKLESNEGFFFFQDSPVFFKSELQTPLQSMKELTSLTAKVIERYEGQAVTDFPADSPACRVTR